MDDSSKDRTTLKSYFKKGCVPTEAQFADLIDSVPNLREEGGVKVTPEEGLHLHARGPSRTAATLFAADGQPVDGQPADEQPADGQPADGQPADGQPADAAPLWRLALGEGDRLELRDGAGRPLLTVGRTGQVSIAGTVRAAGYLTADAGRAGRPGCGELTIQADGRWHDLPVEAAAGTEREGCRVYRLSALYRNLRSGSYSVCEATASHSGGRRRRIRSASRHWWGWSGHIEIRWRRKEGRLYLQVRSRGTAPGAETIRCRVETSWEL